MDRTSLRTASEVVGDLAVEVLRAQRILDSDALANARKWRAMVDELAPPPTVMALAEQIAVGPIRLSAFSIDVTVELQQSEQRRSDVGLTLLARPIHSFFASRFGAKAVLSSHLQFDCRAVPAPPEDAEPDDAGGS